MPKLTIDGRELEVPEGMNLIQAAGQIGIDIPHYCYHPDLPIDGNCRMCLVEVEKMPKLTPACATFPTEGMIVRTNNERVKEAVRGVLEFLLINHPVDCPVCDQAGECRLQDYYMVYGLHTSEIPLDMKVRKHKAVDLGAMVVLDSERCVLCSRCIRFFENVTGTGEMQFFGRGDHVEIGTIENKPLTNPYSGNVVDICPVGALTSRDFRFKCRVWFLLSTDSICGGCATGCNVRIDHRDGTIFRMIARRNVDVNKSWMCDEGRLSFHELQTGERVTRPLARGRDGLQAPVTWDQAIQAADAALMNIAEQHSAASIIGFASPSATNEALFLFKRYLERGLGTRNLEFRLDSEDVNALKPEDKILRRLDKHPNSIGARNLGLFSQDLGSIAGAIQAAKQGRFKAGVILYLKPLVRRTTDEEHEDKVAQLVRSLEYSVVLAAHKAPWLGDAGLVLPIAHWSEEEGSYTNYQGLEQRAYAAISPEPDILPVWQVMSMLLEARGEASVWTSPGDVRSMMESGKAG